MINSFDNNINKFVSSSNNVVTNFEVNRSVVSITNGSSIILAKLDTGDNVQWVNLSNLDSNLFIDTNSENLTGADRRPRYKSNQRKHFTRNYYNIYTAKTMITDIIKILQSGNFYNDGEYIEIAKGKKRINNNF